MPDLPAELWTQIFDLAADEDVLFQHGLPTTMAESAWFKDFFGEWALRSPQDAIDLMQRRSYATKKAIVRTCKQWRSLGSEFLFRCLFFNDPARLLTLCAILDSSSAASTTATRSLGWWTRRIHLTRFYVNTTRGTTPESLQDALISIIRHCPNLEIFIVDWPMTSATFGPVADALATYTSKSLRTLHVNVPASSLPKVIWTLAALPRVFAAHIELEVPTLHDPVDEEAPLGAARDIHLHLPALAQLSLRGAVQAFLEQATGWALPTLRHLSVDCGTASADLPDVPAFLAAHGARLLFLDLHALPALPVPRILAACPALATLAFNADWRVVVPEDDDAAADGPPFTHDRLTSVGLHGLAHAFGVGYAAAAADAVGGDEIVLPALLARTANDRTFSALCTPARFPALRRVRVLSRSLLGALDRADGPGAAGGGMERWERWWDAARGAGVRLEDCTGGLLGVLPQDATESDEESEDDEEEEEEEELEWSIEEGTGGGHLSELRRLLEECRAMDTGRDENYMFQRAGAMGGFPEITVDPPSE
ncbi:hypothetical protein DFH07DRAFT_906498 [Mycena maculata]|uniref:Uncharacterized protein n=1 Tax=Mycena maculata TaxID=230809 RepID=A0AAD7HSK8_9AGAR|nr:hypothetical protein DFH07DRAFT_906498 [Mycena maculata]